MTLQHIKFTGTITRAEQRFPVEFEAWAGDDSRLQIEIDPLPSQVLFALQGAMGQPGSFSEALMLEGFGADGATLFSDSIDVRGANFGTDGNILKVTVRKAKVVLHLTELVSAPLMRLWFRGFKSFRNPVVNNSLGSIEVAGDVRAAGVDDMSGYVTIRADPGSDFKQWVDKADNFLTFMHR